MADDKIGVTIGGGQNQGVFGAGSVVIENFAIYNRAPQEPDTEGAVDAPLAPCPYPGLAYFGPNDSALFFGRDAAIERLTAAVSQQSFTALVGASGSGKSSVVLAGLAPRLHGMGGWRFSHFRLGSELEHNAFLALARALVPLFTASEDDIDRLANTRKLATKLQAGELTLRDVFADSQSRDKGRRILLIADQFEESFTLIEDEAVRHRFIDVLLAGFPVAGGHPDISLILTMRADFYGRALQYRPLADTLQGHVENLGPMSREELRTAIVQPAENAKVLFDPGLVETLLDDVERKPGSLPLLQFALREMWGRQEKRKITRQSYDAIDGVEGALARRAETIFAEMTSHGANARVDADFQRLFTRLVTPGEGQEDTRRVAERRELGDEVWSLAQRLAGETNRLVVTNAQGPSHETAEVVHEALIRNWPTMAGWITRDRAFLSWLQQIKPNLELWSDKPTDDAPLLRGGMLAQASDWFARRGDDLSPAERGYIEASIALRQREEDQKEAARQAEIRRQQELAGAAVKLATEQRRRARIAVGGASAVLVFAVAAAFAFFKANTAAEQAIQARDLARFAADTMKKVSGAAFAKAADLASVTETAVASSSPSDRAKVYDQFALYDDDAGDWEEARRALKEAGKLLRGSSDRVVGAYHHEVSGDLQWGDPSAAQGEYAAALTLLDGSEDLATERAAITRKIASALINQGKLDEAAQKVTDANFIIKDKPKSRERALLLSVSGQIELARHNDSAAIDDFRAAVASFTDVLGDTHRDLLAGLGLGQTLQMMGDAERRKGLAHAYDSYDQAIRSLEFVLADDPTLLDALRSTELARRGLRLLSMTDKNDAARKASRDRAKSDFEKVFGEGIGKFRFGMTTAEVNRLLKPPFDPITRAPEYTTSDVRYLCRWFGDGPPEGVGCGGGIQAEELTYFLFPKGSACMLNYGYAVFMFSEDTLFRIVVRFLHSPRTDPNLCPERTGSIDELAGRNQIIASGGYGTRRLRYETDEVGLVAASDDDVVSFDFEQR